jgi:hypothetical protein
MMPGVSELPPLPRQGRLTQMLRAFRNDLVGSNILFTTYNILKLLKRHNAEPTSIETQLGNRVSRRTGLVARNGIIGNSSRAVTSSPGLPWARRSGAPRVKSALSIIIETQASDRSEALHARPTHRVILDRVVRPIPIGPSRAQIISRRTIINYVGVPKFQKCRP